MRIVLFTIISILFFSGCKQEWKHEVVFSDDIHIMPGDSLHWKELDYNYDHWYTWRTVKGEDSEIKIDSSICWYRMPVTIPKGFPTNDMVIRIVSVSTYQAYWDGQYIGSNGQMATDTSAEVMGDYIDFFPLTTDQLQSGDHVLAMRSSKQSNVSGHTSYLVVGDREELTVGPIRFSVYMFMLAGVLLTGFVYFLFAFFSDRQDYALLVFSIICLCISAILLLEYSKHVFSYPYLFQYYRMRSIGYLHVALTVLVPYFLQLQFKTPYRYLITAVIIILALLVEYNIESGDAAAIMQNRLMWIASIGIVIYAISKKHQEAFVILAVLILAYITHHLVELWDSMYVSSYDVSLFLEFFFLVLAMLYLTTTRRRKERIAYEESLVTSERLRSELLRKNIRPHFIMNTLTSLIDWVEEAPEKGVEFIHELAAEFRLLNDMADHQLVSIQDEIALCKNHLGVMSYRRDIKYKWQEHGIDHKEMIPPAILLTMVENGVTHSYGPDLKEVQFSLSYEENSDQKSYTLQVATDAPLNKKSDSRTGTGSRYIMSRLKESYGDRASYTSEPMGQDWLHKVTIKK